MNLRRTPITGWVLDGVLIHPVEAYHDIDDWLSSFEGLCPERKKRMREYSARQGWNEWKHRRVWANVIINFLNSNAICK